MFATLIQEPQGGAAASGKYAPETVPDAYGQLSELASTFGTVDDLFYFTYAVCIFFFVLILGVLLFSVVKYRRKTFDGEVFWLYVLLYAITRGILETWRGDFVRGFVIPGVLSTSQAIGLVTAAVAGGMLFYLSRRHRAEA